MNKSSRTPLLFIGHGSPMNALAHNDYTEHLAKMKNLCPQPQAILCISAHWQTQGTQVTHMENPKTIHDFFGFPKPLFDMQYPAPGSPSIAQIIAKSITSTQVTLDDSSWGLDHGTWSVLCHMFPEANIPVLQLSLNKTLNTVEHFQLGKELQSLRDQGVLIVGSGNVVHNLRLLNWEEKATPLPWAVEFDQWVQTTLKKRDFTNLTKEARTTQAGQLSIPTWEHWWPLLYIAGASTDEDTFTIEYEEIQNASISMLCVSWK